MRYLLQRVVHNNASWVKPTPGRRGFKGDGDYLEKYGFGHEDWNFSRDVCADGYSYGYTYFHPRDPNGPFNILFAIYDKGKRWALCGYYLGARYTNNGAVFPRNVLRRRASELKALDDAGSLGGEYRGKSVSEIVDLLKNLDIYRWQVRPTNVHRFRQPIPVPKNLASRFGAYFATPTELTKRQWKRLIRFSTKFRVRSRQDDYSDGGDTEFPEGKQYEVRHKVRERNRKLVAAAKARFKEQHGRLFCEACKFDFADKYGVAGEGFIEVHHKIPVSRLRPHSKTRISDLALVCSNCHRILHRQRPWLDVRELRQLIRRTAAANAQ